MPTVRAGLAVYQFVNYSHCAHERFILMCQSHHLDSHRHTQINTVIVYFKISN